MKATKRQVVACATVACISFAMWFPAKTSQVRAQVTLPQRDLYLTYGLHVIEVTDAPTEEVWVVESPYNQAVNLDGVAFRSLASPKLRSWLSDLPKHTIILYTPPFSLAPDNSVALHAEKITPALQSEIDRNHKWNTEIDDLSKFCHSKGLQFAMRPTF